MTAHRLVQAGALLFLLGLLTGFAVPAMASPRLGLSSHLEGVMNGTVLMVVGLIWPRLQLSSRALKVMGALVAYGAYVNWLSVTLAALWAAGSEMMPLAGGTATGTAVQEALVKFGLVTVGLTMTAGFLMIVWGLRKPAE